MKVSKVLFVILLCGCEKVQTCFKSLDKQTKENNVFSLLEAKSVVLVPQRTYVTKWPGGVVKYFVNVTYLTLFEQTELNSAINEFHDKTCIKFEKWTRNPKESYVSIERDYSTNCGYASVCKRGQGYQYARFHRTCMKKATFVHELGHTLCLLHEHQRTDRSEFLDFPKDCPEEPKTRKKMKHWGIYDYASQLHYKCGGCLGGIPKSPVISVCGDDAHSGLSVKDADTINRLYDCKGCHRHRWISLHDLTGQDKKNMYSFGHTDFLNRNVYPCRAFYQGEIAVGSYTHEQNACHIYATKANILYNVERPEHIEILTIPGSLDDKGGTIISERTQNDDLCGSRYQFQSLNYFKENGFKEAVSAGSLIWGKQIYLTGYIMAYYDLGIPKNWGPGSSSFLRATFKTYWNAKLNISEINYPSYIFSMFVPVPRLVLVSYILSCTSYCNVKQNINLYTNVNSNGELN